MNSEKYRNRIVQMDIPPAEIPDDPPEFKVLRAGILVPYSPQFLRSISRFNITVCFH